MDWVPNSDPFVAPNRVDEFDCGGPARLKGEVSCHVVQSENFGNIDNAKSVADLVTQVTEIVSNEQLSSASLPRNGYRILFVPSPEDVELSQGETIPGTYTTLPIITPEQWKIIAAAFRLPGHFDKVVRRKLTSVVSIPRTYSFNSVFKEKLWMHVGMTRPRPNQPAFAHAATHFETNNFTFALMVGCTKQQIRKVERLMAGWKDAAGHPLLMLGICAELHLDRLELLMREDRIKYQDLLDQMPKNEDDATHETFSWELINQVRDTREAGKEVEAEVNTTRLQLSNAVSSAIKKLLNPYRPNHRLSQEEQEQESKQERELDLELETTHLFEERFNDILNRLDGLSAQCRVRVENISYTTEIIRSQLARRESLISSNNSKLGMVISLLALTYLPLTAVASVMSMPIFGWANDWRDWRYRPVRKKGLSTDESGTELPVVSGYIAIYFPIALTLMFATILSFFWYYKQLGKSKTRKRAWKLLLRSPIKKAVKGLSRLALGLSRSVKGDGVLAPASSPGPNDGASQTNIGGGKSNGGTGPTNNGAGQTSGGAGRTSDGTAQPGSGTLQSSTGTVQSGPGTSRPNIEGDQSESTGLSQGSCIPLRQSSKNNSKGSEVSHISSPSSSQHPVQSPSKDRISSSGQNSKTDQSPPCTPGLEGLPQDSPAQIADVEDLPRSDDKSVKSSMGALMLELGLVSPKDGDVSNEIPTETAKLKSEEKTQIKSGVSSEARNSTDEAKNQQEAEREIVQNTPAHQKV